MAQYTAIFTKPYEDGYENLPSQNTPITAETLNDKDDAIVNIESYLSGNDIPSDAEGLSYDNTDSGLTADNVQSAIDEIVTDIPTTAEAIGYDNTDSGLTADDVQGAIDELADEKVDKTGVDVKTNTTGQFNTITGGILNSCVINLEPVQSGSGTPSPDNVRPITGHSSVEVDVTDADSNTTQYTISLGQTVYGGTLDAVSGVLTVTHELVTYNGSESWGRNATYGLYYVSVASKYQKSQTPIANIFEGLSPQTASDLSTKTDCFSLWNTLGGINVNADYPDVDSFKSFLSSNNMTVAYELATPLTIQLTPQQIETLIGQNNISVPLTGQSLDSLTYREMMAWDDVEKAINVRLPISAIGTDESNNDTASKAYSQGDYFYKNGIAKAKTSIAQGATFTLNTNYEIKTLAEILQALEA